MNKYVQLLNPPEADNGSRAEPMVEQASCLFGQAMMPDPLTGEPERFALRKKLGGSQGKA